jgi:hypothetical protein
VVKAHSLRKYIVLLLGLGALLLIAACSPPPPLRDANLLSDDSLITDQPCAAPCWNNITPGVTTWNDALTILEDDVNLENVQTQTDDNTSAVVAEFQRAGGTACCQMFSEDGELVSLVFLRLAPEVTTAELLDAQGDPSYAIGSEFSEDQAIINLLYPSLNTVVYAFVAGTSAELTEDSELIGVLYMQQKDMDLLLQTSNLHAWQGFGPYQMYSVDNTDFAVTPSVTLTPTPEGG